MKGYYFIMTRRYICYECKENHARKVESGEIEPKDRDEETQYTFTPTNAVTKKLAPYGRGMEMKAVLTKDSGLDEEVLDLMRPLFNAGVRPATFSKILMELHTKEHTRMHIKSEHEITRRKHELFSQQQPAASSPPVMFSPFSDPAQYGGAVPSGKYLAAVYKQYASMIKEHYCAEVKKRGAEELNWDVSYKEAKHLCR